MQTKAISNLALNITSVFQHSANNSIIFPGDILIKESKKSKNFIQFRGGPITSPTDGKFLSLDEIVSAEYFNLFFSKTPILFFHGYNRCFGFSKCYEGTKYFSSQNNHYLHLNHDMLNETKTGECYLSKISILNSKLGNKFKIIKHHQKDFPSDEEIITFEYKIKDHIAYKRLHQKNRGIFERLQWFKKSDKIQFPYLFYLVNNEDAYEKLYKILGDNIFREMLHLNKNGRILKDIYQMMYQMRKQNERNLLEIFCTKENNKNSDKRIYFYKNEEF